MREPRALVPRTVTVSLFSVSEDESNSTSCIREHQLPLQKKSYIPIPFFPDYNSIYYSISETEPVTHATSQMERSNLYCLCQGPGYTFGMKYCVPRNLTQITMLDLHRMYEIHNSFPRWNHSSCSAVKISHIRGETSISVKLRSGLLLIFFWKINRKMQYVLFLHVVHCLQQYFVT